MELRLVTGTPQEAERFKNTLLKAVHDGKVETWSYDKDNQENDIIFHNPKQYTEEPEKNVIFGVTTKGREVVFETRYWGNKTPSPTYEANLLHCGRLAEMLFTHFGSDTLHLVFIP